MFLKIQLGDYVLQVEKKRTKKRETRCQDCVHDGFVCTHPKSGECQLAMFYGGDHKYFEAKSGI